MGDVSRVLKGAHPLQGCGLLFSVITIITHCINLNFRDDFCRGVSPICRREFISDHYS